MNPQARPTLTQRVAWQHAADEAVIIDLQGRRVMGLNATGSFLWGQMDGQRSVQDLAALVATEFGVPTERALQDVVGFLEGMSTRGFVAL